MKEKINLNPNWMFHQGEIDEPNKLAKKSYALGGLTAPLENENGEIVAISAGGNHFLKLIAQGNVKNGLRNLAGTKLLDQLDSSWTKVDLPDDWKRRLGYKNNPRILMSGSKLNGVAYYRKNFELSKDYDDSKEYILHFDGIMHEADIWMNGAYLGHNDSGYTELDYDISPLLRFKADGSNVILVKTDTTAGDEGWWYEGAGIYKNVWLEVRDPLHFVVDEIFIHTLSIKNNVAKMQLRFAIENNTDDDQQIKPQVKINDKLLTQITENVISAHIKKSFTYEFEINNPQLWSPEHANLYKLDLQIPSDKISQNFGIRTFDYDTEGFILNGQRYELHGVCEHQDFLGVGVALNQDIIDYKIKRLKEMGVNALRSSHHFASKELLNACDRLGIILINENRLLEATPWRLNDLNKMVKKSRNHACLAIWSIANEEIVGNTTYAERSVKKICSLIRSLNPDSLLISAELLNPEGIVDDDYLKLFDVLGVNYPEAGVMGDGAELIHKSHPDLPMMSTENASYFSTRGIYKDDGEKCQCNNLGSMYSMVLPGKRKPGDPGVGGTAHPEQVMEYLNTHSYMGGVFLWTGLDYYGEPSPFGWPGVSSQFGICDLGGLPKDYYYYYQAHWTDKPVLHLMPHWNMKGLTIEDGKVNLRVFSNLDEIELFLNGKSLGRKEVKDYESNWTVVYTPGELEARGYRNNSLVATDKKVTTGMTNKINIKVLYRGKSTTLFELEAIDEKGNPVPDAQDLLSVQAVSGKIIGLGNGDPADVSPYSLSQVRLFSGKAVIIVKNKTKNEAKLKIKTKK